MYNYSNTLNVNELKERLKSTRVKRELTQKQLADKLNCSRSNIVQWEGVKYDKVPTLRDFLNICSIFKVDPNYLLGLSDIESDNDKAISKAIGLSYSNISQLREKNYTNKFIDFFLSSSKAQDLIYRLKQVCYYEFIYEALETSFLPVTLKKITETFNKYSSEIFPLDMNINKFETYLRREIPWKSESITINEFIDSTITKDRYNNILVTWPDFEILDDYKKFEILISDIAVISYDYLSKRSIIDLSRLEIIKTFDSIIDEFIRTEFKNFKNRDNEIKKCE